MSESIEQLANKLGIVVRTQGSLRLIQFRDCKKVIEACKSEKLLILGIEAFKLSDSKVIPNPDLIADFSELALKQWDIAYLEVVDSTENYFGLIKDGSDLWFDFVLKKQ